MLAQTTPDNPLSKPLLQVSNAADRAAALTRQMLALGRQQIMQVRVINVNSVVSETSHMLRRIIGEDIRLVTKLCDKLENSRLDPDQVGQVILNLAVNARDAMPEGGMPPSGNLATSTWTMPTARSILQSNLGAMSCWRSATPEPASTSRFCPAFSILSSPPKKWAKAPAWGCPSCMEL